MSPTLSCSQVGWVGGVCKHMEINTGTQRSGEEAGLIWGHFSGAGPRIRTSYTGAISLEAPAAKWDQVESGMSRKARGKAWIRGSYYKEGEITGGGAWPA